ncbi:MAG: RNA methyltransferase [Terracidiphilus sp.]|nr:RNA methyltransferase [Terracidiphilus sp.]
MRQSGSIRIVLVRPRNPLNIGAAARAMANFGFADLAVVDAYEPHWREARSAVDAEDLLQNALAVPTVDAAVAPYTLVLGTGSLTYRKPEQPVVQLPALTPLIRKELARGGRIALVFGPEKHGLTRDDLSWCHQLIEIPTSDRQPSMNLAQAVAVCLYEISTRALASPSETLSPTGPVAPITAPSQIEEKNERNTSSDLDRLASLIEESMTAAHYSPNIMQQANRHDLRLMLRRLAFNRRDLRRALGLFRRILVRLNQ